MNKKAIKNKGIIIRLIFFTVLIVSNTFGWFIYVTRVDNNVSVHVKSWNVTFQSGDKEISNTVELDVDDLYPGMEDYVYEINAYNKSEVSASLSYTVLEANIFGKRYITVEGKNEYNEDVLENDLTSSELEDMFKNDYPFKLIINLSNNTINESDGSEKFSINIEWPYENNNDELDTEWGIRAAEYKKDNPTESSITLKIKVQVTQNND